MKRIFFAALLLCTFAHGQAARYDSVAQSTATLTGITVTVPAPSATITVCSYPAAYSAGSACTNKASLCTDITASICSSAPPSNPISADSLGNFGFWAAGGVYQYMVCPASGACQGPYNAVIPWGISGGSISGASLTITGTLNITGALFKGRTDIVDVVADCGLVKDNVTDNLAAMNTCLATNKSAHYIFPSCSFNPQGGGTANVPCYYFSGQIVVSYNGTWFDGPTPSLWNALVSLRFPTNTAGVRFDTNCYGCKISNLGLVGGDAFSSSNLATFTDWTPALLTSSGADGLQLLGGSPLVENVGVYWFARHGIFIDGSSSIQASSQPDAWTIRNVILSSNRGYGIHAIGCDSNVGVGTKIQTVGNMLAGIYDYSCLGNTWIGPNSSLDGRSAISAGATSNITTVSVAGTTMSLVTATAVAGWVASTWVTVAGTVNCNGTFKVLSGTSSNMTLNYPSGSCASEAVGTAQKASSASVFSTLTARSAGAGQAAIIECAYGSRSGSSIQVVINPYQESNSAAPCWDTGTLVVGGQLASTATQALGQGFTWIQNSGGGLVVKGGQAFTFQNPADTLTSFTLKAGATAAQDMSFRFASFDGSLKHTIKFSAAGASFTFLDTGTNTWLGKTIGGSAFLRGATATEDIAFNQSSGRDELHYCGGASVCFKVLNSDSNTYVNSLVPLTINAGGVGTNARPFPSIFLGTAATNNIAFTPAAVAAARTVTVNDPLANSTLRTEISGTATVDLASVATAACSADSADVTVTGARVGDAVSVTAATALEAGGFLIGRVTASNTGRFQLCNLSGGAIDRASDTYTVRVAK